MKDEGEREGKQLNQKALLLVRKTLYSMALSSEFEHHLYIFKQNLLKQIINKSGRVTINSQDTRMACNSCTKLENKASISKAQFFSARY